MEHFRQWIPKTVKALRADMTLKQLSDKCGLSVSYLSDIERGRTEPSIKSLDAIFTACGVTLTIGFRATDEASAIFNEWTYVRKSTLRNIVGLVQEINPDNGGVS